MTTVTLTCDCGASKLFEVRETAEATSRSYVCPQCKSKEEPQSKQEERRGKLYQERGGDPGRALRSVYPEGAG